MPKKRKLSSLDDKCRICLSNDGSMIDIFSDNLRVKIDDLGKSASIPIDDDEILPRNICHVCLYKLEMWVDFKQQFVRSDAMLRDYLELGELSDSKGSLAKRKHSDSQVSSKDDSPEQGNPKKLKSESPTAAACSELNLKTEKEGESNKEQVVVMEDTLKAKEESDMTSDVIAVPSEITQQKVKQIGGRRAKTTERRKESTRRWVARKKALLAATGENDTDTDSMVSDDEQLSPVQKARAKCNAEKVAAESHRRMTRAMENVDSSNISGYYGTNNPDSESHVIQDSDTEVRKERMNCTIKTETPADGGGGGGGDARLLSTNLSNISPHRNNSIAENSKHATNDADDNLLPNSVRSELMIDGVTFVVTSTLVLSEPHYLKRSDEATQQQQQQQQERNTDIIDAVELRRVSPKNAVSRIESKLVDTCLNIEVEGTELDSLQRVQSELTKFLEKGLKSKLAFYDEDDDDDDGNDVAQSEKIDEAKVNNDAFQTLDQQLKTIVEKTIKKNLENSRIIDNRGNNTFTGEFLKAALRSKIFQPRVYLVRYDASCDESFRQKLQKTRKTNVLQDIVKSSGKLSSKKNEELPTALPPPPQPPPPLGKRRSVQPAKYADYAPFDSECEEIAAATTTSQILKKPTTVPKSSSKVKTYGPAAPKSVQTAANPPKAQQSLLLPSQKPSGNNEKSVTTNSSSEKHICGVCGDSFGTRKEVEAHFGSHKKQKMMRCKRCHEIVEARLVKSHVCSSSASKNLHKCRDCVATFRTEQLLARHAAESHEFEREPPKIEENISSAETPESKINVATAISSKSLSQNERSDLKLLADSRETSSYTCFVCDKTFTDEELLKDHLQKHCDDMSEDERNNAKDYQCAICGESLDSEDALGTHVEKHLFDDEDDNPNLISIGDVGDGDKGATRAKRSAEMLHSCGQCSENFDSEMLLMLHQQAHEEEVAIAEWERRGVDNAHEEQHVCVICADLFATEDDLSEHLDIHNGTHICMLCDRVFLTLEELQSHVNTH